MKKTIFILITFIVTIIPLSCEDSILFVDCNKCFENISDKANLEVKLTINSENNSIPITIYRGTIDNGEIISEDTAYTDNFYSVNLDFDQYYSVVAKYKRGGRIIYAVDGKKLSTKYDKNSCTNPCYIIKGGEFDLRLK